MGRPRKGHIKMYTTKSKGIRYNALIMYKGVYHTKVFDTHQKAEEWKLEQLKNFEYYDRDTIDT